MIYLDNNATTLLEPRVAEVMKEQLDVLIGNPSSTHRVGQQARQCLVDARKRIAACLSCQSDELCFTGSATEAINLLLSPKKKARHIVSSALEHHATLAALGRLESAGSRVTYLTPFEGKGAITPEQIEANIDVDTDLLVFMAANNETGVKSDIVRMAEIAERRGIPLLVDGVALFGKEPFILPKGVSGFVLSGHKIHGPHGIGLAMIRKSYRVTPLIVGGGQQFGRRAGSENIVGIMAFAKAIELATVEAEETERYTRRLRDMLEEGLQKALPQIVIHGKEEVRVPNVSQISFPGEEAESLLIKLDLAGLCVSHGAACSSGGLELSHVLLQMGIDPILVRSAIRFSLSRFTTEEEIKKSILVIKSLF